MKKTITKTIGASLNALAYIAPSTTAKLGFKLFCHPIRTPMKGHHSTFLNPAKDFNFEFEGNTIQVYRWGTGKKKLLLLHGWQSHTYRWKNYIEALSKTEYTIYAIDAPAHGFSTGSFFTVPLYSRTINQLISNIGEIETVIAHSIGGFSILYSLYFEKELPIKKLVVMAAPGEAMDFLTFYKNTLGLSDKTAQLVKEKFEHVINNPIEFYSTKRFAAAMTKPGLIIHDELDDEALFKYGKQINAAWSNSTLLATKNLGHNLKSPEVVKSVVDFVNEPLQGKVTALKSEVYA